MSIDPVTLGLARSALATDPPTTTAPTGGATGQTTAQTPGKEAGLVTRHRLAEGQPAAPRAPSKNGSNQPPRSDPPFAASLTGRGVVSQGPGPRTD